MRMRTLFAAALAVFSLGAQAAPEVGDPAPDFTLPGSDGEMHSLSDYRGRYVVIAFFPKAFTGGWTLECKSLRDSDRQIRNFDVAYFMASTDSLEDNTGFAEKNGATFPILADETGEMVEAYGVGERGGFARRWTFYIDEEGIIERIDRSVSPRTAGEQLVANLEELGAPGAE